MPIETITRAAKRYYEELYFQQTARQLFYTLFGLPDESTNSGFLLDKLIGSPYAVTYRQPNGESHVRKYTPGSGVLIEPPIASEKTPLSEDLLNKVIAGVDSTANFGTNEAKLVNDIMREHVSAFNMLKNYQAMQVFVTGQFQARGKNGTDVGLDIDYSRDAGNTLTADFAVITITEAFTNAINQLSTQGTPKGNLVAILGSSWVGEYSGNSEVQGFMQNNNANVIVDTAMIPPELLNTEGLYVIAKYRGPNMIAPLWICDYSPPVQYVSDLGETAAPYIGATKAVFFSLDDIRYKVNRGINIIGSTGNSERVVGDLVVDQFSENDPVTKYLRSQTRHALVPANIDHTVVSTGSNFN
jgi:hypothetical protein